MGRKTAAGGCSIELIGEFFRVREVAARLGVHQETVRRWIWAGDLPHVRFSTELRIFSVYLGEWLEKNWTFPNGQTWDLSEGREEWHARLRRYAQEKEAEERRREGEIVDIPAFTKEFVQHFARIAQQKQFDAAWESGVQYAGPLIGQIVTCKQVADYLKVDMLDIQLLSQRGAIPTFKAEDAHHTPWLCSIPLLDKWIIEQTENSMGGLIDDLLPPRRIS